LRYEVTDYATVSALRHIRYRPAVLSGGALVCCSENQELFLHLRSSYVETYPRCWHVFGGNFIPSSVHTDDDESLTETSRREIFEEMRLCIDPWAGVCPAVIAEETSTGFVQFLHVGVDIPKAEASRVKDSPEGRVHRIRFADLKTFLLDNKQRWVPSGKMHVLGWLAMGAPAPGHGPGFNHTLAHNYFNDWLSSTPHTDPSVRRSVFR
jgi:hypothetical protein